MAILRLTLDNQPSITVMQKIEILNSVGLRPSEIARILGIGSNQVSVTLVKIRKRGEHSATPHKYKEKSADSTG